MIQAVNNISLQNNDVNTYKKVALVDAPMRSINFEKVLEQTVVSKEKESVQNKSNHQEVQNAAIYQEKQNNMEEISDLEDIFIRASQKYNVSLSLLKAVAKQESNFQTTAVSKSGARGIMQLMPATAKALGVDNSFNPEQNIMGGADFLSQMLAKYNGNVKLALAAYNAGPGSVDKYNGVPPYRETQDYVKKVTKYMNEAVTIPDVKVPSSEKNNETYDTQSNMVNEIYDTQSNMAVEKYKISYQKWLEQVQLMASNPIKLNSNLLGL